MHSALVAALSVALHLELEASQHQVAVLIRVFFGTIFCFEQTSMEDDWIMRQAGPRP